MDVTQSNYAIFSSPGYSIAYGGGLDLYCHEDICHSRLGFSYQLPSFLSKNSNEADSFLGGSSIFQVVEIEVYLIALETQALRKGIDSTQTVDITTAS